MTHLFAAWIIVDMMFSARLDNVDGTDGMMTEYDFIIGEIKL